MIKQTIRQNYDRVVFSDDEKHLYVELQESLHNDRFIIGKYTYLLTLQNSNLYEVRKLSNTYNMNVIFTISINRSQDSYDLKAFESDL